MLATGRFTEGAIGDCRAMMATVQTSEGTAAHWDDAYRHGDHTRSWFQHQPATSLAMFDAAGAGPGAAVIDVGGGASRLVDALLARGYRDLTVLDVSPEALTTAQARLGHDADRVEWLVGDLLTWQPERTWDVWHDRALLHFFTDDSARTRYLERLTEATAPGGTAILATFAPDGPQQCSGLDVHRYDADQLAALLGARWQLIAVTRELHATPSGGEQPFTWTAFRHRS